MYFGIASNYDMRQPNARDKLRETFAVAHVPAEIEVYSGALHGWLQHEFCGFRQSLP
jgi:carboxymethylenebutenolidase